MMTQLLTVEFFFGLAFGVVITTFFYTIYMRKWIFR